ncbi:MAG: diaminopimelate epimerase [Chitinophagales bacterium]
MPIKFYKYHGTGNDFILFDNRSGHIGRENRTWFAHLCDRHFGIGADGVMLLEEHAGYDFEMVYYNADGNPGSMCGNGARCMVSFAHAMGIQKDRYAFLAADGPHSAERKDGLVFLRMSDVHTIERKDNFTLLHTGSPHYIRYVDSVQDFPVVTEGAAIRYSDTFREDGINVNFVERLDDGVFVRTYERGVEDETLSCGTGVTAVAIAYGTEKYLQPGKQSIPVKTLGGNLRVEYTLSESGLITDVILIGPAEFVFEGILTRQAF